MVEVVKHVGYSKLKVQYFRPQDAFSFSPSLFLKHIRAQAIKPSPQLVFKNVFVLPAPSCHLSKKWG